MIVTEISHHEQDLEGQHALAWHAMCISKHFGRPDPHARVATQHFKTRSDSSECDGFGDDGLHAGCFDRPGWSVPVA